MERVSRRGGGGGGSNYTYFKRVGEFEMFE